MMRAPSRKGPVTLTASVCARSIASPSRISTSEGGITTPMVLAMQVSAALRSSGMPAASSFGCTARDSIATLAPTEPFIGASNTPRLSPASGMPAPVRAKARLATRNRISANGSRFSMAPMNTYSGKACSKSCSSRPRRRAGIAVSSGRVNAPMARPPSENASATPISSIHAGRPVAIIRIATQASMNTPAVGIIACPAYRPARPARIPAGPTTRCTA